MAHCALSLVGEPIMYPHINELVSELHRRRISSFLVTNAQVCLPCLSSPPPSLPPPPLIPRLVLGP